jgi:hypothetical protein
MNFPATAVATSHWAARREADELLAALARTRLEAAEWRVVRRGLGLMAGSLAVFLICALGVVSIERWVALGPILWPLAFLFLVGLPISGGGFLAGVVLSLMVPRRVPSAWWISTAVGGLVAGVVLLLGAWFWRGMSPAIAGVGGKSGALLLVLAGVGALLVAHLGYCLYLAGLARRFDPGWLARWFKVLFVCLALEVGLIVLAEVARRFWLRQAWRPLVRAGWDEEVFAWVAILAFGTGVAWIVLLWRLRRRLPREETGTEPGEE